MSGKQLSGKQLSRNLNIFSRHLDSINDSFPMIIELLKPYAIEASSTFKKFSEKHTILKEEDGEKIATIPSEHSKVYVKLAKNAATSALATIHVAESFFVSLISKYDSFLGELLKIIFTIHPEIIDNSERQLSFTQLKEFSSIEEAREYIIEKEIETVMRKSHSEQFDYLEAKCNINLRKDLPIWAKFIEITERRNLYVHCGGIVSNQYLSVCKKHNVDISKVVHGKKLKIDIEYFKGAYLCLFEISTKLTHTLWRKLLKADLKSADEYLNELCYNLLAERKYNEAEILLDFACNQVKHHNEETKSLFVVNKALCFYLREKNDIAQKIMATKDWSASSNKFKLANLIIQGENEKVYNLMKKIGPDDELKKEFYRSWPLFYILRETKEFKETYKEIFNEDYTVIELPKAPIENFLEKKSQHQEIKTKKEVPLKNKFFENIKTNGDRDYKPKS